MKNLLALNALALSCLIAACGTSTSAEKTQVAEAANSSAKYLCGDQYIDTSLQQRPLWTESFAVDLTNSQDGLIKDFGVSPGTGGYHAFVGVNKPDGLALMIYNDQSGISSAAVYEKGAKTGMVVLKMSATQTLSLSCLLQ